MGDFPLVERTPCLYPTPWQTRHISAGISSCCRKQPTGNSLVRGLRVLTGNTPLLAINCEVFDQPRTIYAKAENLNFTGSHQGSDGTAYHPARLRDRRAGASGGHDHRGDERQHGHLLRCTWPCARPPSDYLHARMDERGAQGALFEASARRSASCPRPKEGISRQHSVARRSSREKRRDHSSRDSSRTGTTSSAHAATTGRKLGQFRGQGSRPTHSSPE